MEPYKPLDDLARAVTIGLALALLIDGVSIISNGMQLDLLSDMAGGTFDDARIEANDNRQQAIAIGYLLCFVVTAILFWQWMRRAYNNLPTFGRVGQHNTAWAFWGWVVPIMNLFRPYQMMKELWLAPSPQGPNRDATLIGWWWAFWLIDGFIGQTVLRQYRDPSSIDALTTVTQVEMAGSVLNIATGVLGLLIIKRITLMQSTTPVVSDELLEVFD